MMIWHSGRNMCPGLHKEDVGNHVAFGWTHICCSEQILVTHILSAELQKPQPLLVSEKVLQYTSNLYGSMPPIGIVVPS